MIQSHSSYHSPPKLWLFHPIKKQFLCQKSKREPWWRQWWPKVRPILCSQVKTFEHRPGGHIECTNLELWKAGALNSSSIRQHVLAQFNILYSEVAKNDYMLFLKSIADLVCNCGSQFIIVHKFVHGENQVTRQNEVKRQPHNWCIGQIIFQLSTHAKA